MGDEFFAIIKLVSGEEINVSLVIQMKMRKMIPLLILQNPVIMWMNKMLTALLLK